MKKIYILSSIFIILITLIFFRDIFINLSLPLLEDRIRSQLNIEKNDKTTFKIETDFKKRSLTLKAINAYLNDGNYIEKGFAKSLIVEKEFKNLFNNNISNLIIDGLSIDLHNYDLNVANSENISIDDIFFNLKIQMDNFDKIIINSSSFNISSIIERHIIHIDNLEYDGQNQKIIAAGKVNNDNKISNYQISNFDDEALKISFNLNSYSANFLKKINQFSSLKILFNKKYNGQITIITNLNFDNFNSKYDIISADDNVSIVGDYNYKDNVTNSKIILNNILLQNYLPENDLFNYINISQFGNFKIHIEIINNINNINFYLENDNIDFIADGTAINKEINNLDLKVSNVVLQDLLKDFEYMKFIDISQFKQIDIKLDTQDNFKNTNFYLEDTNQKLIIQGATKNNKIYELNSQGSNVNINQIFKNLNSDLKIVPSWINNEFFKNNSFSFDFDYLSDENNINISLKDKFLTTADIVYNLENNQLHTLKVNFFDQKDNNLFLDGNINKLQIKIDKNFEKFFIDKFKKNIFKNVGINFLEDYKYLFFEGNINEININDFQKIDKISKIFNKVTFKGSEIKISQNQLPYLKDYFNIEGFMDLTIEQDHINKKNNVTINLDNSDLKIEKIKYEKKINQSLRIKFNYAINNDEALSINNLEVKGKNALINGNIKMKNNNIISLNLDTFKLLDNNISLILINDDPNSISNHKYKLQIKGKELDLSFIEVKKTKSLFKDITLYLDINVKKFQYINDTNFSPVEIKGKFRNVWKELSFKGLFETGEDLNINIKPADGKRYFEIDSTNSGKTLRIKKISKSINGGQLLFKGNQN